MFAVKYNGGNKSYFGCSDPDKLVRGQIYEVIAVNDRGWQTITPLRVWLVSLTQYGLTR